MATSTVNYQERAGYPRAPRLVRLGNATLYPGRTLDTRLNIPPALPASVILVHGVNDVGTGYGLVEAGLCAGLATRLGQEAGAYRAATYRVPEEGDHGLVLDDPDAVYYKRKVEPGTRSPVIPFYWGFRELDARVNKGEKFAHRQDLDRSGTRLDKDYSKGGGPFINATSSLPDLWNKGHGEISPVRIDPLRPTFAGPGRMYFVLAAQRLAALISMIRDYHAGEVVNLVAHSQGTLLSLMAQALLLEWGLRPADTLVLCSSCYGLEDQLTDTNERGGGEDALMQGRYDRIAGRQTLHARLQTLVDIVRGVRERRATTPFDDTLKDADHRGLCGSGWNASADRDNRGKVYLYFSPEDVTVNLRSVQGIGWQGVPDVVGGSQALKGNPQQGSTTVVRKPMDKLMETGGFFQRVFTLKLRPHWKTGKPVLVGQAPIHDFQLKVEGEDFYQHVGGFQLLVDKPARTNPTDLQDRADPARHLKRRINAEALKTPVAADLLSGSVEVATQRWPAGSRETVDPIDAAIAATGDGSYREVYELIDRPVPDHQAGRPSPSMRPSPRPEVHAGYVNDSGYGAARLRGELNAGKPPDQCTSEVMGIWRCLDDRLVPTGQLLVLRKETPQEVRLRYSGKETALRSFHSAIYASRANHERVTAYDLAIGQGTAVEDPAFRDYLCAVADWRLKRVAEEKRRPGILYWDEFEARFSSYFASEAGWRKALIVGNRDYYSTGVLPDCVLRFPEGLPACVTCETFDGGK